ncbi:MAG: DUF2092 domain-containing protein [Candidatus Competibacteraceae bacterium]|nr:DUF2092 domain-containing protein [Candidatus Competibacteraceae bacterium]
MTTSLSNWNLTPQFSADTFTFKPPQNAQKIAFLADLPAAKPAKPAKARSNYREGFTMNYLLSTYLKRAMTVALIVGPMLALVSVDVEARGGGGGGRGGGRGFDGGGGRGFDGGGRQNVRAPRDNIGGGNRDYNRGNVNVNHRDVNVNRNVNVDVDRNWGYGGSGGRRSGGGRNRRRRRLHRVFAAIEL